MDIQSTSSDASNPSRSETVGNMHSLSVLSTNQQVAEKVDKEGDGSSLDIHSIFYTIQGEGPYAGTPAVFIRLAGCVLQCPQCDTDYTSGRKRMSIDEIVTAADDAIDKVRGENAFWNDRVLAVITGGEPLRQPCGPLVGYLIDSGYRVQIETNGLVNDKTLLPTIGLSIVCSPKGMINPELKQHIKALKYIVKHDQVDEDDGLPTSVLGLSEREIQRPWIGFRGDVFVQPCDEGDEEKNKKNLQTATEVCMKFNYRLCLQLHKIIGVR